MFGRKRNGWRRSGSLRKLGVQVVKFGVAPPHLPRANGAVDFYSVNCVWFGRLARFVVSYVDGLDGRHGLNRGLGWRTLTSVVKGWPHCLGVYSNACTQGHTDTRRNTQVALSRPARSTHVAEVVESNFKSVAFLPSPSSLYRNERPPVNSDRVTGPHIASLPTRPTLCQPFSRPN